MRSIRRRVVEITLEILPNYTSGKNLIHSSGSSEESSVRNAVDILKYLQCTSGAVNVRSVRQDFTSDKLSTLPV